MQARVALLLLFPASLLAFEPTLDRFAIEQAIRIGQSRDERERSRFHAPYRLLVGKAQVDYIDIITPFRRVTLAAEHQTRMGQSFGQRQALELLGARPAQVDILVELTFHPLNAYVGVPEYDVVVQPATGVPLRPQSLDRLPRFGPRVEGTPPPSPGILLPRGAEPMLGGTVAAAFDGTRLAGSAAYEIVVLEKGKEIAKARASFGSLR